MMKKWIFILLPYIFTLAIGSLAFFSVYLDWLHNNILSELSISLATTFISIPILYFVYDKTKKISERKLNIEVFEYAKVQVDQGILSLTSKIQKIFPSDNQKKSLEDIVNFLNLNEKSIEELLRSHTLLGFQAFKKWNIDEDEFHTILKNPFILQQIENEQIISIIELLKHLRLMESIIKDTQCFIKTESLIKVSYKIAHGSELSAFNNNLPERYILLKEISEQKYVVEDFGDFYLGDKDKLLLSYKINQEFIKPLSSAIYMVISIINKWLKLTGNEFLIDGNKFHIAFREKGEPTINPRVL